jgi:hypothetical protein
MTLTLKQKDTLLGIGMVLETLGLALMIGGMLALGAFVAPAVFGHFPREEAGKVMTLIFRRYDYILLPSVGLIALGEILRTWVHGYSTHIVARVRYVVFIILVVLSLFSILVVNPKIEAYQHAGALRGVGAEGIAFDSLHRKSEALYKSELLLAIILLILVSIPPRLSREE